MGRSLLFGWLILLSFPSFAGRISGLIQDDKGNPLPYASVIVSGTSRGVAANSAGRYSLVLSPGTYTLVCQYVGYKAQQKTIQVTTDDQVLNFVLAVQELAMQEVVIKKGEDPANEIIRQTIRRREYHNRQVDSMTVDVYIKGLMRSRAMPEKIFGQKIERDPRDGIDSAGRGILFLSESLTKVSYKRPDKFKYDVISSRESGGGYGLSFPIFINFYVNNVSGFSGNINPRGFISPISDNAFHYYRFKYEGNFFEGDKMINRIRVTPRRKNEPLFDGYIQVIDEEWKIHSLELLVTRAYSLELIDTLRITQIHAPVSKDIWRARHQVIYVTLAMFGFDVAGNFLNVYTNYNVNPSFGRKFFGRTFMKYDTAFNKRDSAYWSNLRPVPLEADEKRDFTFKDSISKAYRDSAFSKTTLDSLRRQKQKLSLKDLVWSGGYQRRFYGTRSSARYRVKPLLKQLQYNTVEGVAVRVLQSLDIYPWKSRFNYRLSSDTRYGVNNEHLNAFGTFRASQRKFPYRETWFEVAGGRRLSQFNPDNPVDPLLNSLYTLFDNRNYLKVYENWFGGAGFQLGFDNGVRIRFDAVAEDRLPVHNTTAYSFTKQADSLMLPNHPYELAHIPFERHQAFVITTGFQFQPGQRYIQYPYHKQSVGSDYPTFAVQYSKGVRGVFGSDIDFDKWKLSVFDDVNLRMLGNFKYRFSMGGFLNNVRVAIPDMQHFNGNQTIYTAKYVNSFQLAPYYRYSNTESWYGVVHAEHHFNGLLTNKIPLFNRLKWYLVAGSNAFYVNNDNYYVEAFAGLENIFKLLRVDIVSGFQAAPGNHVAVRVGFGGLLGNSIRNQSDDVSY